MPWPQKWCEELEAKAIWYVDTGWKELGHAVPSVARLARLLGVARSTIHAWSNDEDKRISDTLEALNAEQEGALIDNGLTGVYNSNIVKLMLANHGYGEKIQEPQEEVQESTPIGVSDAS